MGWTSHTKRHDLFCFRARVRHVSPCRIFTILKVPGGIIRTARKTSGGPGPAGNWTYGINRIRSMDFFDTRKCWEIFSLCVLYGMILYGILWARNNEKIIWNGGVCADTKWLAWKSFDMDSSGARGYTSSKDGKYYSCWISYGWDK